MKTKSTFITIAIVLIVLGTISMAVLIISGRPDTALSSANHALLALKTNYDSRQIRFAITGGSKPTFEHLKIVGANQYNEIKTWNSPKSYSRIADETTDYWWRDTVVITFSSEKYGKQTCVIDYLSLPSNNEFVNVTYDGRKCSGDSGSASPVLEKEFDMLYALIYSDEDSLKLVNEIDSAYKPLECATEIANGIAANGTIGTVIKVIKITSTCGNMAIDKVNQILKLYNNKVE